MILTMAAPAQQTIALYGDRIPNSIPSEDKERVSNRHNPFIHRVSRPTLTAYLPDPEVATGTAVIICPGGAYRFLAAGHEGIDVARALNKEGIAAFVLKYRLPDSAIMHHTEMGPLQDAQQAMLLVRSRAEEYGVDADRIGIMGFSAGGHLASTAGTHFAKALIDNPCSVSLRPDFMVLIYPVISMQDSLTHAESRTRLLGATPSQQAIHQYSNETRVTAGTPPTFLVHASDDDAVRVGNSLVFYQQLLQHGVLAEMHLYQKGGHGFGLQLPNRKERWLERCVEWIAETVGVKETIGH